MLINLGFLWNGKTDYFGNKTIFVKSIRHGVVLCIRASQSHETFLFFLNHPVKGAT